MGYYQINKQLKLEKLVEVWFINRLPVLFRYFSSNYETLWFNLPWKCQTNCHHVSLVQLSLKAWVRLSPPVYPVHEVIIQLLTQWMLTMWQWAINIMGIGSYFIFFYWQPGTCLMSLGEQSKTCAGRVCEVWQWRLCFRLKFRVGKLTAKVSAGHNNKCYWEVLSI